MSTNGHLPDRWWVVAEWGKSPAEAINDNLATATKRLGAAPTVCLLHPLALAGLGVELTANREDGKTTTTGVWSGLVVLSVERRARKGAASQAQRWDVWYGRNGAQPAQEVEP